jgi:hypothetical protein
MRSGVEELALAAKLRPQMVLSILTNGTTSRQGLRRLRRGLRFLAFQKLDPKAEAAAHYRLTLPYLSADVQP